MADDNGREDKDQVSGGDSLPGNNVQTFREGLMMSKAELARKAGLSTLTIDRVEAGRPCRLDTKRKILLALGLRVGDKDRVFGAEELAAPSKASTMTAPAPHATSATASVPDQTESSGINTSGTADASFAEASNDGGMSDAAKGGASR